MELEDIKTVINNMQAAYLQLAELVKQNTERGQHLNDLCDRIAQQKAELEVLRDEVAFREANVVSRENEAAKVLDVVALKNSVNKELAELQDAKNLFEAQKRTHTIYVHDSLAKIDDANVVNAREAKRLADKEKTLENDVKQKLFKKLNLSQTDIANAIL